MDGAGHEVSRDLPVADLTTMLRDGWAAAQASDWALPFVLAVALLGVLLVARRIRSRRQNRPPGPVQAPRAVAPRQTIVPETREGPCRWNAAPGRSAANLDRWICLDCGIDAFTSDGRPPKECKRDLREGRL